MKKAIKKIALLCAAVMALVAFCACGPPTREKASLTLSAYEITLEEGETGEISVTESADSVMWKNKNSEICDIVPAAGGASVQITGKSAGETQLTAVSGGMEKAVCVVVEPGDPPPPQITVGIENNAAVMDMGRGENTLDLQIGTVGVEGGKFTVRSDNYAVAKVSDSGIVTAKSNGTANIYVEAAGAETVRVEITVIGAEETELEYPLTVHSGYWPTGHVQGIAVDEQNGYIYYTFTTVFVKTDFEGNVIGWFSGYEGHLGDCTYNSRDGKVYASLTCTRGEYGWTNQTTSYVAVIDADKITRQGMDAYDDGIMKTVWLQEILIDYYTDLDGDGKVSDSLSSADRKYGVTGIDGICFGPKFGETGGKQYLTVAYAIARNENRTDNDYLVFLQYDVENWHLYGEPLDMSDPHSNGPRGYDGKYFLYTGNTDYGVQTMDYDASHDFWVCITYNYVKQANGPKKDFYLDSTPDITFLIDNTVKPQRGLLKGQAKEEYGEILTLVQEGRYNAKADIYSWAFWIGNTGFAVLDNGLYYVAEHAYVNVGGEQKATATVTLYRYTGSTQRDERNNDLFARVSAD